jgi:hypothetical protein
MVIRNSGLSGYLPGGQISRAIPVEKIHASGTFVLQNGNDTRLLTIIESGEEAEARMAVN